MLLAHLLHIAPFRHSDSARSDTTSRSRTRLHGLCCIFILYWWKNMQYVAEIDSQDATVGML